MKSSIFINRAVALILAAAMLTNCTVYKPIAESPVKFQADKEIILLKDNLTFRLEDYYFTKDTIFGSITHDITEPPKGKRMVLVLWPEQDLNQDSHGMTIIPFSSIKYMEYFEKNKEKSRRNTILLITGVVGGTLMIIWISFLIAVTNNLDEMWNNAEQ